MMISPDDFYRLYLKGKSIEETLSTIRGLRIVIGKLKKSLEEPNFFKIQMCPDENTQIGCTLDYLERAKLYLVELGYKYEPTKKELKLEEFNSHLWNLEKIILEFHGSNRLLERYEISIAGDKVILENKLTTIQMKNYDKNSIYLCSKEKFVEALENLNIGEWRKRYIIDERYNANTLAGTQWSLEIQFDDGFKNKRVYSCNAYPYNFDKLKEILELNTFEN